MYRLIFMEGHFSVAWKKTQFSAVNSTHWEKSAPMRLGIPNHFALTPTGPEVPVNGWWKFKDPTVDGNQKSTSCTSWRRLVVEIYHYLRRLFGPF